MCEVTLLNARAIRIDKFLFHLRRIVTFVESLILSEAGYRSSALSTIFERDLENPHPARLEPSPTRIQTPHMSSPNGIRWSLCHWGPSSEQGGFNSADFARGNSKAEESLDASLRELGCTRIENNAEGSRTDANSAVLHLSHGLSPLNSESPMNTFVLITVLQICGEGNQKIF
ncbi:hypothetical protein K443DRAFT_15732 [Laccaria amethystina LaAM-08-1]|uniref:Uncharacterized protein n=1 Tax=Laccaria amethystina LaAM-08-1 TaxID=1095629 RepID=A0A0C9WQB2_9AGAR|nr:hypothetical protein K443DRAFT_15732 [Laccaria amethystina LaAM-08-1]